MNSAALLRGAAPWRTAGNDSSHGVGLQSGPVFHDDTRKNIMEPVAHSRAMLAAVLALLTGVLAAGPAWAGIPERGVILYGQVLGEDGELLTSGELVWRFTPPGGGEAVTVQTAIREITGPGGPYSYRVLVPFERAVPGLPVTGSALPVSTSEVQYLREGEVAGTELRMAHEVSFATPDFGSVKRVDLCSNCPEVVKVYHSADTNFDNRFSLRELMRFFELHEGAPGHEYHVRPGTEDGYGVGPGPRTGQPHTGDYDNAPDWAISMPEVVRMIDLFVSTPEHRYAFSYHTADGFEKGWGDDPIRPGGAPVLKRAANRGGATPELKVVRTVAGGLPGSGRVLDVTISVEGTQSEDLSALGLREYLPAGWVYLGTAGPSAPALAPKSNTAGTLDFAWFPLPAVPFTFSYQVAFSPEARLESDVESLFGTVVYRTIYGEDEHAVQVYRRGGTAFPDENGNGIPDYLEGIGGVPGVDGGTGASPEGSTVPGTQNPGTYTLDTDGDGIPDYLEPPGDLDGDGIPNFMDLDSDNDGLTDEEERLYNGDEDFAPPYGGNESPAGPDLDPYNPDTDGDGVNDGDEVASGSNPLMNVAPETGMPAGSPLGLALAVALMGAAGMWKNRRPSCKPEKE